MIKIEGQPKEIHSQNVPTVSVIIPAYNASKHIGEALQSVSDQTFTSYETIVINDGSPDTEEFERALEPYASQVHYMKQENRGAGAARNIGISAARGEFVAFLDADDKWSAKFLERQMEFLKKQQADLVYADARLTGETPTAGRTFMQLAPSRGAITAEKLLASEVTVLTSTVLARKQRIVAAGLFDEAMRRGQDFDLWFRLAKLGARLAYNREILAEHRIMESSLSGGTLSQLQRTLAVLESISTKGGLTSSEAAELEGARSVTLANVALENGKQKLLDRDFQGALISLRQSMRHRQSWKVSLACLGLTVAPELLRRLYVGRAVPSRN
jgi:cellulose synthase/poly-beta-1,6-N-acetylglucosamine synthase-like glycosyltransferase